MSISEQVDCEPISDSELVRAIDDANKSLSGLLREAGRRGLEVDAYPMDNGAQILTVYRKTQVRAAGPGIPPEG